MPSKQRKKGKVAAKSPCPDFWLSLSNDASYDDVVGAIGRRIGCDPYRLRLRREDYYNRPESHDISRKEDVKTMLRWKSNVLYYRLDRFSLEELKTKQIFNCIFFGKHRQKFKILGLKTGRFLDLIPLIWDKIRTKFLSTKNQNSHHTTNMTNNDANKKKRKTLSSSEDSSNLPQNDHNSPNHDQEEKKTSPSPKRLKTEVGESKGVETESTNLENPFFSDPFSLSEEKKEKTKEGENGGSFSTSNGLTDSLGSGEDPIPEFRLFTVSDGFKLREFKYEDPLEQWSYIHYYQRKGILIIQIKDQVDTEEEIWSWMYPIVTTKPMANVIDIPFLVPIKKTDTWETLTLRTNHQLLELPYTNKKILELKKTLQNKQNTTASPLTTIANPSATTTTTTTTTITPTITITTTTTTTITNSDTAILSEEEKMKQSEGTEEGENENKKEEEEDEEEEDPLQGLLKLVVVRNTDQHFGFVHEREDIPWNYVKVANARYGVQFEDSGIGYGPQRRKTYRFRRRHGNG